MPKKITPKRKTGKRKYGKAETQSGFTVSVTRYFISVTAAAFVVGTGFLAFRYYASKNFCANSITCIKDLSVQIENDKEGVFAGLTVEPPKIDLTEDFSSQKKVLGTETPGGSKRVDVDLTSQTLTAYEGDKVVLKTFVSTGKWFPTPTGDFKVWIKVRAQLMSGGVGADYYYLPNVPYVMFFGNDKVPASRGFSLHGAYWHNNFGHPMSHGCVNMRTVDAQALYNWIDPVSEGNVTRATNDNPGTLVHIFGEPPEL